MIRRTVWLALVLLAVPIVVAAAPSKRARPRPVRATAPAEPASARRLDDIHIEGEIPVPQVLFVSVREQRRFLDFEPSRWLRPARVLAGSTPFPTVTVRTTPSVTPAKESAR